MQDVGIIGLGAVSSRHLSAVESVANAQLVAVSDINENALSRVGDKYNCRAYSDYRELLQDEEIGIVIICLPHFLHMEASVAALEAGKHVLVEKPMAINVEQCDRMIEASNKSQKLLSVGHMHHFFPKNVEVKHILDNKELGELVMLRDEGYRPFKVEGRAKWYLDKATQGGLWYQNGIHLIDRACWWVGSRVVAVKAMIGSRFYDFSADDVATAMLHFENGVYATLIHVWWKYGATFANTDFVCVEGMIKLGSQVLIGKDGSYEPREVRDSYDAFNRQLEVFIATIETGSKLAVTPEYARELVRVLIACEESARTGREVVLG
jgi:predicted dehydrogenase